MKTMKTHSLESIRAMKRVPTIIDACPTVTTWANLPEGATEIKARPEGTKWEVSYTLPDGSKAGHFTGCTFTQSPVQIRALLAL